MSIKTKKLRNYFQRLVNTGFPNGCLYPSTLELTAQDMIGLCEGEEIVTFRTTERYPASVCTMQGFMFMEVEYSTHTEHYAFGHVDSRFHWAYIDPLRFIQHILAGKTISEYIEENSGWKL